MAKIINMHDMTGSEAYDATQCDENIDDGDVLDLGSGNIGILVEAWPAECFGTIDAFHQLSPNVTWETLDAGKYAKSYNLAKTLLEV